ncbi:MAG: helix-turn-helix domain-containing protein [archaeon]|jgi:predicted transcriptional regulator
MAKNKLVKSNYPDIYRPEVSSNLYERFGPKKIKLKSSKKPFSSKLKRIPLPPEYALPIMKGSVKHVPTKRSRFKVVVRRVERPFNEDFEHQLAWICSSLGFFEPIDKDKNAAAVFKEVVLATENGEALTSTAIAERIGMSRGAVINHLNNLLRSGLLEKNGRFYSSRSKSMKRTIEEIEEDVERVFAQLKKTAEDVDRQIGFNESEQD